MSMYSQAIDAGGKWQLAVPGTLFRLIATDNGEPVDVRFFRGGQQVFNAEGVEAGLYAKPLGGFDRVDITSATAQTVKVLVMDGDGGYDRFIVDIASSVGVLEVVPAQGETITDIAPVTVGTSATALTAVSTTRKSVRFMNAGSADVYLGGAGVTTANGCIRIGSGETYIETNAAGAAWYGISGTAGQSVRVQEVS